MNQTMKSLFSRPRRTPRVVLIVSSIAVFLVTSGILFYEGTKKTVALSLDGEKHNVKTHASTIQDLLKELDVSVGKEDYLSLSKDTKIKDNLNLTWEPAVKINLVIDGKETEVKTTAHTVGDFLEDEGIVLSENDTISTDQSNAIKKGMQISIEKAFPVTLVTGNSKRVIWSTSTTVADFLKKKDIAVNQMDRVEPALNANLTPNAIIKLTKVEKVTDVVEEPISYATITKKDSSMLDGKEKVVSEGKEGLLSKKYEITKENGKIVSKKLISETTVQEKTDKVVAVGTKVIQEKAEPKGNESATGNEYYVTATAYTSSCNGCSGRTTTGINLKSNPNAKVIAVDPSFIPLGSKVYVEGYGYAVAADTGGGVNGQKIDVFVPSQSQAYSWGVKRVKIKVLN